MAYFKSMHRRCADSGSSAKRGPQGLLDRQLRMLQDSPMNILRKKREAMGLGLVEAAKGLGLDPGNLSRIETGKQTPRLDNAKRIAEFYGVDLLAVLAPETEAA